MGGLFLIFWSIKDRFKYNRQKLIIQISKTGLLILGMGLFLRLMKFSFADMEITLQEMELSPVDPLVRRRRTLPS
jgi:hypothetical protein